MRQTPRCSRLHQPQRDDCRHCPDLLCAAHPEDTASACLFRSAFCHSRAGLNIVVGFTGQISIGHAAFFGFGAFTSAYLSNGLPSRVLRFRWRRGDGGGRPDLRPPCARLKGLYLAIARAAQYILLDFFARAEWFTGGSVPASAEPFSIFGYSLPATGKFLCCAGLWSLSATCWVTNLMRRATAGR